MLTEYDAFKSRIEELLIEKTTLELKLKKWKQYPKLKKMK